MRRSLTELAWEARNRRKTRFELFADMLVWVCIAGGVGAMLLDMGARLILGHGMIDQ